MNDHPPCRCRQHKTCQLLVWVNTRVILAVVSPPPVAALAIRAAAMTTVDDASEGVGTALGIIDVAGVDLDPKQDCGWVAFRIGEPSPVARSVRVPIPPVEHGSTVVQTRVLCGQIVAEPRHSAPKLVLH